MAIIIIIILISLTDVTAQWMETNGPYSGEIKALASSGTDIFAGTSRGVFRSLDFGLHWNEVNNGLTKTDVTFLLSYENNLYAGTRSGIFLSTNSGDSWTFFGLEFLYIASLCISGNNFIAATSDGIYITSDNGVSWFSANNGIPATYRKIITLASLDNHVFTVGSRTMEGIKFFHSTNYGLNWYEIINIYPGDLTVHDQTIYAACYEKVYRSTNFGLNWQALNIGVSGLSVRTVGIQLLPGESEIIYAGTNEKGIYRTTNNGLTWTAENNGLTGTFINKIVAINAHVFTATQSGAFHSSNKGEDWQGINDGLKTHTQVLAIKGNGTDLYAGTFTGGIFLSTNVGDNWIPINDDLKNPVVRSIGIFNNSIFVGTIDSIFLSTNNGNNWLGIADIPANTMAFWENYIWAGTYNSGVFRSTNYGLTWEASSSGLSDSTIRALAVLEGKIFAGTEAGVFISTNYGESWNEVNNGLWFSKIFALAVVGSNLYAGTNGGVYISSNSGLNWSASSNGIWYSPIYCLAAKDSVIFAGSSQAVFCSTNNGAYWFDVSSGSTSLSAYGMFISGEFLFTIGTYNIYRRALQEMITSVGEEHSNPTAYLLEQNYPNPFNPVTKINYSTPEVSFVKIKIFDILGNEIETLVNSEKPAGTYELIWNGGNLPSGVYFYSIQTADFTETKKMILMK